jgi:hypothetical protein
LQSAAQLAVVSPGRLEDDQSIDPARNARRNGCCFIGDPNARSDRTVKDIKGVLGDIDSDDVSTVQVWVFVWRAGIRAGSRSTGPGTQRSPARFIILPQLSHTGTHAIHPRCGNAP